MEITKLITCISQKTGIPKAQTAAVIDCMIDTITESLHKDEPVCLTGLGTFEMHTFAPRAARDLNTNTIMQIPARRLPVFRLSRVFKKQFK